MCPPRSSGADCRSAAAVAGPGWLCAKVAVLKVSPGRAQLGSNQWPGRGQITKAVISTGGLTRWMDRITSPQWSPELGLQLAPGPWMRCEQCGRCSGEQAVAGSDGGVRGGAAVQLSSGLRIWSHWSLIITAHTASVSSVTALGRDFTESAVR